MEFIVAEIEGRVDGLERLEVDVHLLLLALIRHDSSTIHDQTIWGN